MGKSRNKSSSEVRHLRGQIRKLEAELKYYKRRSHLNDPVEEIIDEVEDIDVSRCPKCKTGVLSVFDFKFATVSKCSDCDFEKRQGKK